MNRLLLPAIIVMACAARAAAPEPGQLDASPTVFTVMAAINAAGYDADLDSSNNSPLRQKIRQELAAKNIPSIAALKQFCNQHWDSNPTANLGQYISFALSVDGPPNFALKSSNQAPPDALALEGMSPLLAAFYREADIEGLWKRSQPAFDEAIDRYHEPASAAILQVNSYLRNETSRIVGGSFQIYIDLLAAPNQVQTRSYHNNYYVVVSPSAEPRIHDIRHAYLHFMLDPLASRHEEIVNRKRGLSDHAQRAQALDASFKADWLLLTTESLIKAIESRLDHKPGDANEAMREGYILTAYFSEQLPAYEKQEQVMRFYYPEMIKAIDLKREDARLSQMEFAESAPVRPAKITAQAAPAPTDAPQGARKTLAEAEQLYKDRQLEPARQEFLKVLQETSEKPLHGQAYYGLARIAALNKNPELAEQMFQKTLECNPEPPVRAWALVYLGRLADAAGDREQATRRYQEALAVEGASPAARQAAADGSQRAFEKKPN